ncbi:MAG: Ca2+-dependent phosphoinositide-specific phospholipase C [Actinomycetota bacterium]
MRRLLLIVAVALAGISGVAVAEEAPAATDVLRMSHFQAKGTHNSYHRRPMTPPLHLVIEDWDYAHPPLDVQLGQEGVRQFELDVHWDPVGKRFEVLHERFVDPESTCPLLEACLRTAAAWSDANPGHHPIFFHIEPKDAEDCTVSPLHCIAGHYDALDAEIRAILEDGRDRLLTPDEVQADSPTLRQAIEGVGWPALDDHRGEMVFLLHDHGHHRDAYVRRDADGTPQLGGRAMFVEGDLDPGDPYAAVAAIMSMNDPTDPRIPIAVGSGFLVRTYPGSGEYDEALRSGAHMISTNWPCPRTDDAGRCLKIPGGSPLRCNPISARPACSAEQLE